MNPEPDRLAMILLAFPRPSPGTLRDILRFLWMLPAVWAVEGKPAFHLRWVLRGRTVASARIRDRC